MTAIECEHRWTGRCWLIEGPECGRDLLVFWLVGPMLRGRFVSMRVRLVGTVVARGHEVLVDEARSVMHVVVVVGHLDLGVDPLGNRVIVVALVLLSSKRTNRQTLFARRLRCFSSFMEIGFLFSERRLISGAGATKLRAVSPATLVAVSNMLAADLNICICASRVSHAGWVDERDLTDHNAPTADFGAVFSQGRLDGVGVIESV